MYPHKVKIPHNIRNYKKLAKGDNAVETALNYCIFSIDKSLGKKEKTEI